MADVNQLNMDDDDDFDFDDISDPFAITSNIENPFSTTGQSELGKAPINPDSDHKRKRITEAKDTNNYTIKEVNDLIADNLNDFTKESLFFGKMFQSMGAESDGEFTKETPNPKFINKCIKGLGIFAAKSNVLIPGNMKDYASKLYASTLEKVKHMVVKDAVGELINIFAMCATNFYCGMYSPDGNILLNKHPEHNSACVIYIFLTCARLHEAIDDPNISLDTDEGNFLVYLSGLWANEASETGSLTGNALMTQAVSDIKGLLLSIRTGRIWTTTDLKVPLYQKYAFPVQLVSKYKSTLMSSNSADLNTLYHKIDKETEVKYSRKTQSTQEWIAWSDYLNKSTPYDFKMTRKYEMELMAYCLSIIYNAFLEDGNYVDLCSSMKNEKSALTRQQVMFVSAKTGSDGEILPTHKVDLEHKFYNLMPVDMVSSAPKLNDCDILGGDIDVSYIPITQNAMFKDTNSLIHGQSNVMLLKKWLKLAVVSVKKDFTGLSNSAIKPLSHLMELESLEFRCKNNNLVPVSYMHLNNVTGFKEIAENLGLTTHYQSLILSNSDTINSVYSQLMVYIEKIRSLKFEEQMLAFAYVSFCHCYILEVVMDFMKTSGFRSNMSIAMDPVDVNGLRFSMDIEENNKALWFTQVYLNTRKLEKDINGSAITDISVLLSYFKTIKTSDGRALLAWEKLAKQYGSLKKDNSFKLLRFFGTTELFSYVARPKAHTNESKLQIEPNRSILASPKQHQSAHNQKQFVPFGFDMNSKKK